MSEEYVAVYGGEEVELDGFAQMVFRRYAQGFEDGFKLGIELGIQQAIELGVQQERTRILNEIRRAREENQGATLEDFGRALLRKIEGGES